MGKLFLLSHSSVGLGFLPSGCPTTPAWSAGGSRGRGGGGSLDLISSQSEGLPPNPAPVCAFSRPPRRLSSPGEQGAPLWSEPGHVGGSWESVPETGSSGRPGQPWAASCHLGSWPWVCFCVLLLRRGQGGSGRGRWRGPWCRGCWLLGRTFWGCARAGGGCPPGWLMHLQTALFT